MAAAAPATGSGDSGRSPDKATAGQIQGKDAPHTTAQQPRQKKSLAARAQEMAQAAWQVSKIFSPPVQQPVLRVVALWLVAHRIVLTFLVALVVRYFFVCMCTCICCWKVGWGRELRCAGNCGKDCKPPSAHTLTLTTPATTQHNTTRCTSSPTSRRPSRRSNPS